MAKPEFVYVTYIATTPEKLWAALTRGEFTKKYWYGRRIESDWTVGSPVRFFDRDTNDLTDSGVVLECDPPRRLVYTFGNESAEGRKQGYSRVSFTLEPHPGLIKLTLVHDELPDEQASRDFREGWAPILSSLKTFLESGKPLPQLSSFEEGPGASRSSELTSHDSGTERAKARRCETSRLHFDPLWSRRPELNR